MSIIYTEVSGSIFNDIYKGVKFYKFFHNDLIHNGFEYKEGLNIDTIPFNPNDECSRGGLYFCEESKCPLFWNDYGEKISLVEIPDDARVYIENDKFKSDKIIITEIFDFNDFSDKNSDNVWLAISIEDGYALKYVKEQTEELCMALIQQNIHALHHVNNQTEKICMMAIQQNGFALQYVKEQNQTEDICKLAVQQDGLALEFVKDQTEEICKLAVQQNGYALQYVKNKYKTEEICKLSVQKNGDALQYVMNRTDEICMLAIQNNGNALKFINNQTEKLCMLAVQQNGLALQYVNKEFMTEEICNLAKIMYISVIKHKDIAIFKAEKLKIG